MSRLSGIRACVFDAYGTIFDFASAAARCTEIPAHQRAALTTTWRDKQLQYTWLRTLQGRYVDFWQVTGDALDFALDSLDISNSSLHERLMRLYRTLAAFPEVSGVLLSLRQSGFTTAILSNGSPAMLDAVVSGAGLTGLFDAVLSADAVGAFKTHPAVYQYALDQLGVSASAVSFQSSSIRPGSTGCVSLGRFVSILQRVGCARGRGFRDACGLVQPLRSAPRASARVTGP